MYRFIYNTTFGNNLTVLFIGLVLLNSCGKKELPIIQEGSPVFYFSGTVKKNPIHLEAGSDDCYMFTSFQQLQGRELLAGELRSQNCATCGPSLEIVFRQAPGGQLMEGPQNWQYKSIEKKDLLKRQFKAPAVAGSNKSFQWDFGDGSTSTLQNPIHEFPSAGNYTVCLTVKDKFDCHSVICNNILIDTSSCNASFNVAHLSNKEVSFNALQEGYTQYSWDFGDGQSATGKTAQHTYLYNGFYEVCLTISNGSGCQTTLCREISVNEGDYCLAGFNYGLLYDTVVASNGVSVTWRNANGIVFTSNTLNEKVPGNNQLNILGIEEYDANSEGNPTKKITFTLDGYLYNAENQLDSIRIATDTVSNFAVAYDQD